MKGIISIICITLLFLGLESCGDPDPSGPGTNQDNFDRGALLTDVADNVIIPSYNNYAETLIELDNSIQTFTQDITVDNLILARTDFRTAYLAWQSVSMFEIGPAELINLRNFTNIYPTNPQEIEANILAGDYNLELPSKFDEQGFPAIDYLLYGVGSDDSAILSYFDNELAAQYLNDLVDRLVSMTTTVNDDWNGGYRAEFISNSGTSATSSLNKLVNDYLFYYERFLRAGKIGIPAGVFSGNPLPDKVEGFYSMTDSKILFLSALEASQAFFIGTSSHNDSVGESLKTYLDYLDDDGQNLGQKILDQFQVIQEKASLLDDDFSKQIEMDNVKMLETYDELQKNVILLKVDMLQALNIKIDFVDADGD